MKFLRDFTNKMFKALIPLWIAIGSILSGCPYKSDEEIINNYKIKISKIGQLPKHLQESSGLMHTDSLIYTHGDSGTPEIFYAFRIIDDKVVLSGNYEIEDVTNIDWEDITSDKKGSIYVGDFGNNGNNRKNLKIFKLNTSLQVTDSISFEYPDQTEYPPTSKNELNYDCEAFFWHDDHFYLFSKNIKWPYTHIYKINSSGNITLIDSLYLKSPITSADISPDGNEIVLLTYGKVFFFDIINDPVKTEFIPTICKQFRKSGQAEAIAYISQDELVITNEKGKVYLLSRTPKE